jgi:hypothetical protein
MSNEPITTNDKNGYTDEDGDYETEEQRELKLSKQFDNALSKYIDRSNKIYEINQRRREEEGTTTTTAAAATSTDRGIFIPRRNNQNAWLKILLLKDFEKQPFVTENKLQLFPPGFGERFVLLRSLYHTTEAAIRPLEAIKNIKERPLKSFMYFYHICCKSGLWLCTQYTRDDFVIFAFSYLQMGKDEDTVTPKDWSDLQRQEDQQQQYINNQDFADRCKDYVRVYIVLRPKNAKELIEMPRTMKIPIDYMLKENNDTMRLYSWVTHFFGFSL